ncbi:MAG: 16S rRNA (cytosine(1402)-N(4))-methyltransferase RsmH [Nitrospiraceae bacterium]|nr:MAG: 16S rRNA (cytosine(1402)-N(4))-methyltransferase RsmH [Nitrospiraceae bacterium]
MTVLHIPVMLKEVVEMLQTRKDGIYVDATVGLGGHAAGILQRSPGCVLIGIDRDETALATARERLNEYGKVHLVKEKFSNMKTVVNNLGFYRVNGIILDAGVSTLHLKAEGRGFSFLKDEPLDMRMDQSQGLTAEDVVNGYSERELADIIWKYGEERSSRKIAKAIVYARNKKPVRTCRELAEIIEKAVRKRGRIHPATRTFQSLRIEVNRELEELSSAIQSGAELLDAGGRFCILSYHSLEDRIVKNAFRELAKEGLFNIITRKPLGPDREEQKTNPSSRSAKLRVGEKI